MLWNLVAKNLTSYCNISYPFRCTWKFRN